MSAARGLTNVTQCEPCAAGFACPESATVNATELCDPGFYCPGGDVTPTLLCKLGHYCAGGDAVSKPCAAGSYQNATGQSSCIECPPGYWCVEGQITPDPCPAGHYCPAGTRYATESPCPNGTFNDVLLLQAVSECTDCTAGHFCETSGLDEPTGSCESGFFCGRGSATATPCDSEDEIYTGDECSDAARNGVCPAGHFCPEGSGAPEECPPGTMSAARGLANITQCEPCAAGFTCPESGTINATAPCDPGFYCPGGDVTSTIFCPVGHFCDGGDPSPSACAPGTYQNDTAQTECRRCPPAHYCVEGQITPDPCPTGHYCPAETRFATEFACPNGTFSNTAMLRVASECTECLAGHFCETAGLDEPTGLCDAGFYCARGSATATPCDADDEIYTGEECSESALNGVCPDGHYCPRGSGAPTQCPPGTMSSARGLSNISQCEACAAGFTCPESATVNATELCDPGFYCPGGDAISVLLCPVGHYCDGGDASPTACARGTYQNDTGQTSCRQCPPAHYCVEGQITPDPCPLGHYCPLGTQYATQFACPNGTFSNVTMLRAESECTQCIAGHFCETSGLEKPSGLCDGGFFCARGSATATPGDAAKATYNGASCSQSQDVINGVCPRGHYCPVGSGAPEECPPGTMSTARGLANVSQCEPCAAGFTCPESATLNATVNCKAGFYCPGGDAISTLLCPVGHFCDGGNAVPEPCESGTYANRTGQTACSQCPSSYFCLEGQITPDPCPTGHVCPTGTRFGTEVPCPNGTYSNVTLLSHVNDCAPCTSGSYCETEGLSRPTGPCAAGFFCAIGSSVATPGDANDAYYVGDTCIDQSDSEVNGVCPIGHYCPVGSSAPVQCPPGTMSAARGLTDASECEDCAAGFTCPESGTVNATEPCEPGFYCPGGDATSTTLCTIGHYCEGGDAVPEPCEPGTYTNRTGRVSCEQCPAGYSCVEGTVDPEDCPEGYYCPAGTRYSTEYPCLPGTYSTATKLAAADECTNCPAGTCVIHDTDASNEFPVVGIADRRDSLHPKVPVDPVTIAFPARRLPSPVATTRQQAVPATAATFASRAPRAPLQQATTFQATRVRGAITVLKGLRTRLVVRPGPTSRVKLQLRAWTAPPGIRVRATRPCQRHALLGATARLAAFSERFAREARTATRTA